MKYLIWLFTFLMLPGSALAADSKAGPLPARVVLATVQEKIVAEKTPIVGTLYFDKVSKVSTEVSGLVQSIPFRTGDRVNKGDILVRLNTDFIEKDIDLALNRIEQLDVHIEKVGKDLERYETLYRKNAGTEKAYDDIRYSGRELRKQREALATALSVTRLKKDKSAIQAPFDGIILEKCTEVGAWVAPGAVFCRLGDLDALCLKVPVAERLVKYAHEGEKIEVKMNAFQKSVDGIVQGFLPVADLKTKNVMVRIRLPRIPRVVENMSATVFIPTSRPRKLTLVPRSALVNRQGQELVYTVKDGKAEPISIDKVSAYIGEYVGVESPSIVSGMPVIVDGGERITPGQPVQIVDKK